VGFVMPSGPPQRMAGGGNSEGEFLRYYESSDGRGSTWLGKAGIFDMRLTPSQVRSVLERFGERTQWDGFGRLGGGADDGSGLQVVPSLESLFEVGVLMWRAFWFAVILWLGFVFNLFVPGRR
jgi:hypothetical protein